MFPRVKVVMALRLWGKAARIMQGGEDLVVPMGASTIC